MGIKLVIFDRLLPGEYSGRINLVMISVTKEAQMGRRDASLLMISSDPKMPTAETAERKHHVKWGALFPPGPPSHLMGFRH